jgi:PII-like signaling protein
MDLTGERVLLRAYLQTADRAPLAPTHERLVKSARAQGLAGATVLRGIAGFGAAGVLPPGGLSIVEHVPVIVEIVDAPDQIAGFVNGPVRALMTRGTVTLERAHVMMYRHRQRAGSVELKLGSPIEPLSTLVSFEGGPDMTRQDGVLLRIFIGSDDRADGKPLHEAIIQHARQLGLAGATVLRGSEGFGAHSVVHKAALLEMSTDLPIVIEIVDSKENIDQLLPYLEATVTEGMITMEYVLILLYRQGSGGKGADGG